jgi:hypothetical protein
MVPLKGGELYLDVSQGLLTAVFRWELQKKDSLDLCMTAEYRWWRWTESSCVDYILYS